jgi:predicted RNA-binding Zn-ribbon protein involved in translation (DUF1610 family)
MAIKQPLFINKDFSFYPCPECGKTEKIRKSRTRNLLEYILKRIFRFNYYRCRECGWRGKRFSLSLRRKSIKHLLVYLLMGIVFAILCREFLKRMF